MHFAPWVLSILFCSLQTASRTQRTQRTQNCAQDLETPRCVKLCKHRQIMTEWERYPKKSFMVSQCFTSILFILGYFFPMFLVDENTSNHGCHLQLQVRLNAYKPGQGRAYLFWESALAWSQDVSIARFGSQCFHFCQVFIRIWMAPYTFRGSGSELTLLIIALPGHEHVVSFPVRSPHTNIQVT